MLFIHRIGTPLPLRERENIRSSVNMYEYFLRIQNKEYYGKENYTGRNKETG
jgi:hypothetical protein